MKKSVLTENKKGIIIGFIFGVLSVPIATLGLVSVFFEVVFRPIIFVPRLIVLSLMDPQNFPGVLTIGALALVSGVFYAVAGFAISYLYKQVKK